MTSASLILSDFSASFRRMRTAMAIFLNQEHAIESGLVDKD